MSCRSRKDPRKGMSDGMNAQQQCSPPKSQISHLEYYVMHDYGNYKTMESAMRGRQGGKRRSMFICPCHWLGSRASMPDHSAIGIVWRYDRIGRSLENSDMEFDA